MINIIFVPWTFYLFIDKYYYEYILFSCVLLVYL